MLARSKLRSQVAVNPAMPVNWAHPLNSRRTLWFNAIPNQGFQGPFCPDVIKKKRVTLSGNWLWSSDGKRRCLATSAAAGSIYTGYRIANTIYSLHLVVSFSDTNQQGAVEQSAGSTGRMRCGQNSSLPWIQFGDFGSLTGSTTLSTNVPYFITATANSGVSEVLYLNGKVQASNSFAFANDAADLAFSSGSFAFNGKIREFSLWDGRFLSVSDVYQLYIESRFGNPNTLNWLGTKTYSFKSGGAAGPTTGRLASFYAQFQVG